MGSWHEQIQLARAQIYKELSCLFILFFFFTPHSSLACLANIFFSESAILSCLQKRVAGEILAALFLSKEKLPPRLELIVHFPGSNLTHEQSNLEEPWVQNETKQNSNTKQ